MQNHDVQLHVTPTLEHIQYTQHTHAHTHTHTSKRVRNTEVVWIVTVTDEAEQKFINKERKHERKEVKLSFSAVIYYLSPHNLL